MHPSKIKQHLSYLLPKESPSSEIWLSDNTLAPDVRDALLKIADEFIDFLNIDADVDDVIFTGSLANYNYTKFSDIDLHILLDFNEVDENLDLVRDFMIAKKSLWNDRHDIEVKGHEVELYAQDINEPHHSTGVYSVEDDDWIVTPTKSKSDVSLRDVREKAKSLMNQIDKALKTSEKIEKIDKLKEKIRNMRKSGLERSGEFSVENLAFKVLRRNGYLEKLYDISRKEYDKSLSLKQENLIKNYIRLLHI